MKGNLTCLDINNNSLFYPPPTEASTKGTSSNGIAKQVNADTCRKQNKSESNTHPARENYFHSEHSTVEVSQPCPISEGVSKSSNVVLGNKRNCDLKTLSKEPILDDRGNCTIDVPHKSLSRKVFKPHDDNKGESREKHEKEDKDELTNDKSGEIVLEEKDLQAMPDKNSAVDSLAKPNHHQCNECAKGFSSSKQLQKHINHVHLKLKPFKCNQCDASYGRKNNLQAHINVVHLKIKSYKCDKCDKAFAFKRVLKNHVDAVHLKIKHYSCDECKRTFFDKKAFNCHVDTVHLNIRPYQCNMCPKAFPHNCILQYHIYQVHSNIKPYKCDVCNKTFSLSANLRSHIDVVHLKIKPYKCDECNKAFSSKSNLKAHKRTHKRIDIDLAHKKIKPHKCDKAFSNPRALKSHISYIHSRIKPHM